MTPRSLFAVTVLVAIPLAAAMATPTVRLQVPPPGRYGIEDLWKATVTSDTACDAWFEGAVFVEGRGEVFWARTKPFSLTRGAKVYGYRNVTVDQSRNASGYEAFVTRTGTLPEGRYSFRLILQPFGVGDSNGFEVKPMGPPRLLTPRQGDSIAQEPVFSWTPPRNTPVGVTYRLRITEVLAGQGDEEALRSNPPWFEKDGIRGTSLRYPSSGRKLEESKRYAWEVIADFGGGIGSIASESRRFTRFGIRPPIALFCPLEVTRTIGRIGTFFVISAKVRNTSSASVKNIKLDVRSFGFQWVRNDTSQSLWSTGDGTECRWSVKRKELAGGASFFAITMAVPVLGGPALAQRTLFDSVRVSCDIGTNRVGKSPNLAWSDPVQIDAAISSADYLLITRPGALYGKFAHSQVHDVLSAMAELASRKSGVLGYVPTIWWRADIRSALGSTGAWGREMCSDWTKGNGYLLIVGNSDIVASFTPITTWYPEHTGGKVRTSDFSYANLAGDLRPELRVGRLPGSPNDILPGLKTALDNATPGQKAWLVGGPDGTWEPNVKDVETARFLLQFKGISTERTQTEYIDTKQNQLHEAILIWLYENGTPADSARKAYLMNRTEWQYAVGLLWLTGKKYNDLPLINSLETAIGWAVMLEGVSSNKAADIAQALTVAEGIQKGREARGGHGFAYTYVSAGALYAQRNAMAKAKTAGRNVIAWEGHGNVGTWGGVWDAPVNPVSLSGRPVVVGLSCLTGAYEGVNGLPQSFLRHGAAAYLGATEVMAYSRMTECMTGLFWKHWAKFKRIGDVLFDMQTEALNSGISDEGNIYFVNQFNLYGDPKFQVWR